MQFVLQNAYLAKFIKGYPGMWKTGGTLGLPRRENPVNIGGTEGYPGKRMEGNPRRRGNPMKKGRVTPGSPLKGNPWVTP